MENFKNLSTNTLILSRSNSLYKTMNKKPKNCSKSKSLLMLNKIMD